MYFFDDINLEAKNEIEIKKYFSKVNKNGQSAHRFKFKEIHSRKSNRTRKLWKGLSFRRIRCEINFLGPSALPENISSDINQDPQKLQPSKYRISRRRHL